VDSLQINSGEKRIAINQDPDRVIVFNPKDVIFVEKFYLLIADFEEKSKEYQARFEELSKSETKDAHGFPVNTDARFELLKEVCVYIRGEIDNIFGKDASQKAFGDAYDIDQFKQFFDGMTPFIQAARAEKLQKYTSTASAKRNKRKSTR
jgi:hypothetical protein